MGALGNKIEKLILEREKLRVEWQARSAVGLKCDWIS